MSASPNASAAHSSAIVHDLLERGRPHPATVLGALFFLGTNLAMQLSGIGAVLVAERLGQ